MAREHLESPYACLYREFSFGRVRAKCKPGKLHFQVPQFHVNSPALSSATVRPVLPTLTPDARRKRSRRGILFAYGTSTGIISRRIPVWGTAITMAPSGDRFGVARSGIRKELIAFGYPSRIRGPRVAGTTDRTVQRRPACEGVLVRDARRSD